MTDLLSGSLEKLKIEAFTDGKRQKSNSVGSFKVMFNPDAIERHFENLYRQQQGLYSGSRPASFAYTRPGRINLTLVIDGTSLGSAMAGGGASPVLSTEVDVRSKVNEFRELAFDIDSGIHQPYFLKLKWGTVFEEVDCRLVSYSVSYSNFDGKGKPQRAEIQAQFQTESETPKGKAILGKNSADLTHNRIVKAGDTLPNLVRAIYGSAAFVVQLAKHNNLDNFRQLQPGQQLQFPPLAKKEET